MSPKTQYMILVLATIFIAIAGGVAAASLLHGTGAMIGILAAAAVAYILGTAAKRKRRQRQLGRSG
ncbi:hypothetical protein [Tsukamurella paurometabola]|uniref:Uncharacterized protein n=1 Tax=Tsukamurella paurometabola TaxID=2061 RepID=A0ABS5NK64_TSUPA|nr:hypothetical protein [Tsukamurella paurometabola]MBS4104217.1 hypothetical protein [Tsukamurella paurometabola]